jgi:hypothetical protein
MSIALLSRFVSFSTVAFVAVLTVACQAADRRATVAVITPPTPSSTALPGSSDGFRAVLNQPFELAVGQEAFLAEANLHIRFEHILDDSRCPARVVCVWSGQARLEVSFWKTGLPPETKKFSTFSNPPENSDTHTYQGFSIKLVNVDPYPITPDQPIPPNDYHITLLITRSQ